MSGEKEAIIFLECADCEETEKCIKILDYWGYLDCYICENCNEKRYDGIIEGFYG